MATKTIKAWINGVVQNVEVEDIVSPAQPLSYDERIGTLEDKHEVVISEGSMLVGDGTPELKEMTPSEVLEHINGASVVTLTSEEFENLGDNFNANVLYLQTDDNELENSLNNKADTIQYKSGNVISMDNSAYTPLNSLKLFGKTTQNGTPTPDAPVPLESVGKSVNVTVCGKNLFSAEWEHGGINPNDGIDYASGDTIRCGYIAVCPLTTYTLSRTISTSFINVRGYDADKNYIGSGDIVIELVSGSTAGNPMNAGRNSCVIKTKENVHYLRFGDASNDLTTKYQMEIGSTATEYEPYKEQTLTLSTPNGLPGIPVASGGNYTDENGQQWVCDEVDFNRGVYIKRIGTTTLTKANTWAWNTMHRCSYAYVPGGKITGNDTQSMRLVSSNKYVGTSWVRIGAGYGDAEYHCAFIYGISQVGFYDKDCTSVADFLAKLGDNSIEVQYVLNSYTETTLTAEQLAAYAALHTNYPSTTVSNDGGAGMEVKYYTPTTAVQMIHSPADEGKVLSIDKHGCVVLEENNNIYVQNDEPTNASDGALWVDMDAFSYVNSAPSVNVELDTSLSIEGMAADSKAVGEAIDNIILQIEDADSIYIDLSGANSGTANPVNADTLGGRAASEYALISDIGGSSGGGSYDDTELRNLIGNTSVATQINTAMNSLRQEILGGEW